MAQFFIIEISRIWLYAKCKLFVERLKSRWRRQLAPPAGLKKKEVVIRQSGRTTKCWDITPTGLFRQRTAYRGVFLDYTVQLGHSQPYEHTYAKPKPMRRQILEIDKVTTGVSLLTGMSSTTECTTPLNHIISAPMESRTQDLMCYRGFCNQ